MRLLLEFSLKEPTIPIEYRRVLMHLVKTCLKNANDSKYYDRFYEETKPKNFTFSMFFDAPKFTPERILLVTKRVKVIFSVFDKMEGYILYSSFLEKKGAKILLENDNHMILNKVIKLQEPEAHTNKMLIKMNSPLLVRKHDRESNRDQYYSFEEDEFEEGLYYNLRLQLLREGFDETSIEGLKVTPIKCRKVIVQHYGCKFAGSLGNFLVEGNQVVLNYLLKSGLSSRRSEGFGMPELLTDDV